MSKQPFEWFLSEYLLLLAHLFKSVRTTIPPPLRSQVVVPKAKGEILGVVIVESGWGSMLPTIVLANLSPAGPAARCGQLNIGDQVRRAQFVIAYFNM